MNVYVPELGVWATQEPTWGCREHENDETRHAPESPLWGRGSVLWHAAHYMNDYALKRDFLDCVLSTVMDERAREALKTYFRLRKEAPGWNPHVLGPNNHKRIDAAAFAALIGEGARAVECVACGRSFHAQRTTAKFCSTRCRLRAHRKTT